MNNVFSVSAGNVELNVEEAQIIRVDDIRFLSMVGHIIDNGLDIVDGVDAEVLDLVFLGLLELSGS